MEADLYTDIVDGSASTWNMLIKYRFPLTLLCGRDEKAVQTSWP